MILPADEIHMWQVELDQPATHIPLACSLSQAERQVAGRFFLSMIAVDSSCGEGLFAQFWAATSRSHQNSCLFVETPRENLSLPRATSILASRIQRD